jgi:hypothetical protein
MRTTKSANRPAEIESVQRIEHARLEDEVPDAISDVVAELAAASAKLDHAQRKYFSNCCISQSKACSNRKPSATLKGRSVVASMPRPSFD